MKFIITVSILMAIMLCSCSTIKHNSNLKFSLKDEINKEISSAFGNDSSVYHIK